MSENLKHVIMNKTNYLPSEGLEIYFEYTVSREGEYEGTVIFTVEEHKEVQELLTGRPEFYVDKSVPSEDIKSLIMQRIKTGRGK